jgi:hypothetical protein
MIDTGLVFSVFYVWRYREIEMEELVKMGEKLEARLQELRGHL